MIGAAAGSGLRAQEACRRRQRGVGVPVPGWRPRPRRLQRGGFAPGRDAAEALERAREIGQARLVIVASGGISSAARAAEAVTAGADLVQLWTGLVYRGPSLIGQAVGATR